MTGDPRIPRSQPSVAAAKSTEGFGARLASRALRKGINAAKPLVPLTSSHKNGGSHPNQNNGLALHSLKESEADKKDNIDAGPAAHDGRSFTVSNVGNNGRIYLRYAKLYLVHWHVALWSFPLQLDGSSRSDIQCSNFANAVSLFAPL